MQIKLDENLGERGRNLLSAAGHDVATVADQGLQSAPDKKSRCLVTLDLDFSNPFVFAPENYAGIVVVRLPRRPTPDDLYLACKTLIDGLNRDPIAGKLWIVERHQIRQYSPESDAGGPSEELKAVKAVADEHVAQILGYLKSSRIETGLLINFGAAKLSVKKYLMTQEG